VQTRVIISVLCPARDKPVFLFSVSPEGACGTLGGSTAPAAPRSSTRNRSTWHRVLKVHGSVCPCGAHDPASLQRKQTSGTAVGSRKRLRSARDGFCGLLHVPRNCRFCRHAAWFGRTAARTCTWTVRPTQLRACALRRARPASRVKRFAEHASASRFKRFAGHARRRLSPYLPRLPDVPSVIRKLSGPAS
jgi:hypothetical protein